MLTNFWISIYDLFQDVLWSAFLEFKGRHQNSLPLTTNFSQKLTQPSKGISYPVGDLCRRFTKQTLPSAYTLHSNPLPPKRWYKWLFVTCRIHITNRSPMFHQHGFVILLWGILMSPLRPACMMSDRSGLGI